MEESILVGEWKKNTSEKVKVHVTEYKGEKLLSIRVWVDTKGERGEIPVKKGIAIRTDQLPELQRAIEKANCILAGLEGGEV